MEAHDVEESITHARCPSLDHCRPRRPTPPSFALLSIRQRRGMRDIWNLGHEIRSGLTSDQSARGGGIVSRGRMKEGSRCARRCVMDEEVWWASDGMDCIMCRAVKDAQAKGQAALSGFQPRLPHHHHGRDVDAMPSQSRWVLFVLVFLPANPSGAIRRIGATRRPVSLALWNTWVVLPCGMLPNIGGTRLGPIDGGRARLALEAPKVERAAAVGRVKRQSPPVRAHLRDFTSNGASSMRGVPGHVCSPACPAQCWHICLPQTRPTKNLAACFLFPPALDGQRERQPRGPVQMGGQSSAQLRMGHTRFADARHDASGSSPTHLSY
ncbi:hypothetical protein GGTG_03677 [Gaeumannomyces tritici R3-111a-1]|uniref:Uncharacterized protein n=1 Tax=Gaeumannomyces tritici (strain R3-111a-1) TaxID=644352 RepID=J3NQX2_GAET3|nr:hypothetical protein GGTG_03677 [Gaeumannomyces tritici R3-111a-1]EJT78578.1 hypothetical protein GGTG_03677 [Gaeumannomyces tritici R3-111a-1]